MATTSDDDAFNDRHAMNPSLYKFLRNQIVLQESLQRALQPTLQFEQAIQHAAERFSSFQSSWATTLAHQQVNLQTTLQQALQRTLQFEQAIQHAVERFSSFQSSWATTLAHQQVNLQTAFQQVSQPTLKFEQSIKQLEYYWTSTLAQQHASLQAAYRHTIPAEDLQRFLGQIEGIAREVSEAQLNISPEGQIESSSGNLPLAEAAEGIGRFIDTAVLAKTHDELTEKVDAVLRELHKQNSPLRLIMLTIFLPLLINLLSDLLNPALRNIVGSEAEPLQNKTVQTVNMEPQTDLRERIVSASVLNVREAPNGKSRLLGKLYRGQTVHVLQADHGWELVESRHSSIGIRGWVSSMYLNKID